MSNSPKSSANEQATPSNAEKDPHAWATGGDTMTDAQASYLKTPSNEANEPFDGTQSKAGASLRIDALHYDTGRGETH